MGDTENPAPGGGYPVKDKQMSQNAAASGKFYWRAMAGGGCARKLCAALLFSPGWLSIDPSDLLNVNVLHVTEA
jgi:hypothetical protein